MRVYELAKEYDKKSTDFLDIIREFGINVKILLEKCKFT